MRLQCHKLLLLLLLWPYFSLANPATETDILGVWINQAGDGLTEISEHDGIYRGKIVGSTDGKDRNDSNNPDPELRERSLLGVVILDGFKYSGNNKWRDGWVYDPNNGKTYRCKMKLTDNNTLEIRGYIGISLFGRTEVWKKQTSVQK